MRIILTTLLASQNEFCIQAIHTRRYATQEQNLVQLSEETENAGTAEWGFLKNIVNIDTFFATGVPSKQGQRAQASKSSKVGFQNFMQQAS